MILAGTGTVTRDPDFTEHERILRHGPRVPADGLELVTYGGWLDGRTTAVAGDLRGSGLRFPVVHAEKAIGAELSAEDASPALARFEANLELAEAVGARTVVLHLWELPDGDTLLERNLAALPALLDRCDEAGVVLAVETIPCTLGSPLRNVRRALAADPRTRVTLDTEFLALHGELEGAVAADWLWRDGRVVHIHVKDFDGALRDGEGRRRYLVPGEGGLELAGFFAGARRRGFAGTVTLEAPGVDERGLPDLRRIDEGLRRVRELHAP